MQAEDLKGLPVSELEEQVRKLREELFNLRFKAVTEPVTDAAGLRRKRRDVAVVKTVIRQKELAAAGTEKPAKSKLSREGRRYEREAAARWSENRAEKARATGPAKRPSSKAKAAARAKAGKGKATGKRAAKKQATE